MKNCFEKIFTRAKRTAVAALVAIGVGGVPTVEAQTTVSTTFKVCALNVDGLPQQILTYNLNPDGPGSDGTKKIGQYIAKSGIDVVGLSEDFNYNGSLLEGAGDNYQSGTWRGSISISSTGNLDINNLRFPTDGLQLLVKKGLTFGDESWTAWTQNHGKFTDGADELVTKGYRYYKVNLGQGIMVEFYIMHMDAETGAEDNAARASQWEQLRDAILANNSGLPKIVMGDTNSRYTRDDILTLFTNPITVAGNYTVSDVWVEKCKNGTYPTLGADALVVPDADKTKSSAYVENEIVDKVLYLNPTHGGMQLTPNSITFDADNYLKDDGTLLGDHVPVVVEFKAEGTTYAPAASTDFWRGETWTGNGQQVYLYNVGSHYFISNDFGPAVTNISQAPIWGIYGNSSSYTISNSDNYRIRMETTNKSDQGIVSGSGASTFTTCEDGVTEGSYRFGKKKYWTLGKNRTRFFGVAIENGKAIYTAAETKESVNNDWLLISEAQKQAYLKYVELYNEANSLLGERDDLNDQLISALESTKSSNYSTVANDTETLEAIIAKYQTLDVKITDAKYATTCLPWNGEVPAGVTVYIATKYNENANGTSSVHLEKYNATVLPKGVGFMLHSDNAGTYTFKRTNSAAETPAGNIFSGTYKEIANENLDFTNYNYMLLGNKSQGVGFYRLASDSYIPTFRAYILRDKTAGTDSKEYAAFDFETETSIDAINNASTASVKAVFGINGERRAKLERGINMVKMTDGSVRKVLVK